MVGSDFFLDTNALIYLSGLKDSDRQIFKNKLEASNSELIVTHIQIDEKYRKELPEYTQKIKKALESLRRKGIRIRTEATKGFVIGVSRIGHARLTSEDAGRLYNELRNEIDQCQKDKNQLKSTSNIACDATIAISSLDHDFFVTTDKCLCIGWRKVISKHRTLLAQHKIPEIIYARRSPKEVARQILKHIP